MLHIWRNLLPSLHFGVKLYPSFLYVSFLKPGSYPGPHSIRYHPFCQDGILFSLSYTVSQAAISVSPKNKKTPSKKIFLESVFKPYICILLRHVCVPKSIIYIPWLIMKFFSLLVILHSTTISYYSNTYSLFCSTFVWMDKNCSTIFIISRVPLQTLPKKPYRYLNL